MAEAATVITARSGATSRPFVIFMTPIKIVLVRATRVYLQTLVGLLGAIGSGAAGAVGVTLTAGDFWHTLTACASIAVAPAVMSVLLNTVELLARLDESFPEIRA